MKNNSRKTHSAAFKAKVALEALSELKTQTEIAQHYEIHPIMVSQWKNQLIKNANWVFSWDVKAQEKKVEEKIDNLYKQVWQLQVENTWLKKKSGYS